MAPPIDIVLLEKDGETFHYFVRIGHQSLEIITELTVEGEIPVADRLHIEFTGWRPGLRKVTLDKLLRDRVPMPLADAKRVVERVLEGEEVVVTVESVEAAREIVAGARDAGAVCEQFDTASSVSPQHQLSPTLISLASRNPSRLPVGQRRCRSHPTTDRILAHRRRYVWETCVSCRASHRSSSFCCSATA